MRIEAAADGSLVYILDANENQNIEGIGQVTGSKDGSAFSINSNSHDKTNIDFYNHSKDEDDNMVVVTDGSINNMSFNGSNFDANIGSNEIPSFEKDPKVNQVLVNSSNSKIKSDQYNDIGMTASSHDNILELEKGINRVVDAGDYNTTKSTGKIAYSSTKDSIGAAIIADGDFDNRILLYGSHAFVKTGNGNDEIVTGSTAKDNIINAGNGDNHITDNGTKSFISAGSGFDTILMNGLGSFAELGIGDDDVLNVAGRDNKLYGDLAPDAEKPKHNEWLKDFFQHMKLKQLLESYLKNPLPAEQK
jgi:hypothetical protein